MARFTNSVVSELSGWAPVDASVAFEYKSPLAGVAFVVVGAVALAAFGVAAAHFNRHWDGCGFGYAVTGLELEVDVCS